MKFGHVKPMKREGGMPLLSHRPCRICMNLNSPLAGDQRVYKEARTLANAGYEVIIICNQDPEDISPAWRGIKVISIPRRPSLFFPGRFTSDWIRTALALKPDVIHAHDLNTLGRAWLAARLTGARLVYDSHDYYLATQFVLRMPSWRRWYYRRKEGFLVRRADRVIHVVPGLCSIAAREYRIPEPALISNFPMGEESPRSRILHEMFGFAPEAKIVIYEGVIVRDRGLENLVLSARHLSEGTAIVLLGEGYLKKRLKLLAGGSGVQGKVKFIERANLDAFPGYCAAADVGIAIHENVGLSDAHGWPTKVFDYMRAGIPTLIKGCRAMEKLVEENEAGLIMPDIFPEGIARAIADLLADEARYRRLQENARRAWKEKFNWETEGGKLLQLYKELE